MNKCMNYISAVRLGANYKNIMLFCDEQTSTTNNLYAWRRPTAGSGYGRGREHLAGPARTLENWRGPVPEWRKRTFARKTFFFFHVCVTECPETFSFRKKSSDYSRRTSRERRYVQTDRVYACTGVFHSKRYDVTERARRVWNDGVPRARKRPFGTAVWQYVRDATPGVKKPFECVVPRALESFRSEQRFVTAHYAR